MTFELLHGDSRELLATLPSESIDCIATDPPYYRAKQDAWDNQWPSEEAFLDWIEGFLVQFARVLKPSGSLYLFTSPQMAAPIQMRVRKHFHFLNEIVWTKPSGRHRRQCPAALRRFFPQTERIIFAEQIGQAGQWERTQDALPRDVFAPLRDWLVGEFRRAGWTAADLVRICGTTAGHYTSRAQWALPTADKYAALQVAAPAGVLTRDYACASRECDCLRCEYQSLLCEYEGLRRPFTVTDKAGMTDSWTMEPAQHYPGKHPCEKPLPLMERILKTSVRPGGVVLDPFVGSGTTGEAAIRLGLNFLGMEMGEAHYHEARARLEAATILQGAM